MTPIYSVLSLTLLFLTPSPFIVTSTTSTTPSLAYAFPTGSNSLSASLFPSPHLVKHQVTPSQSPPPPRPENNGAPTSSPSNAGDDDDNDGEVDSTEGGSHWGSNMRYWKKDFIDPLINSLDTSYPVLGSDGTPPPPSPPQGTSPSSTSPSGTSDDGSKKWGSPMEYWKRARGLSSSSSSSPPPPPPPSNNGAPISDSGSDDSDSTGGQRWGSNMRYWKKDGVAGEHLDGRYMFGGEKEVVLGGN